jgi:uncharacterized membrane protein YphA (DoxX/SURF4 family)
MNFLKKNWTWLLTIYIAFVFIQSLFFKFTNSPETVYIFQGKLDPWATSLGFPGIFAPGGIFSAKVVGVMELISSILIISGAWLKNKTPWIQIIGAALGLGVISGAIFFHLFTPLGVAVVNTDGTSDGGELFTLACGVWIACALLLWSNRETIIQFVQSKLSPSK